jgi:hypothetical protein
MNIIEKLSNFEEKKRSGFIEYNEDGSGVYIRYNARGGIYCWIGFNKDGDIFNDKKKYKNIVIYIIEQDIIFKNNGPVRNDKTLIYIDGWVREKIDEYYRKNG